MAITDRMGSTVTDTPVSPSAYGPAAELAIKTPVRIATTGTNLTLSGEQTIDSVAVVADDRVLVRSQTTTTLNGIYVCSTGTWTRSVDFDSISEIGKGCIVYVLEGTVNGGKAFQLTSTTPCTIGTTAITWTAVNFPYSAIEFTIDGGGAAITAGQKGHLEVPFNCTIISNRVMADAAGSIVIDVWKDTFANFPPAAADTICASAKPTLTAAQKSQDTTLTGWTTTLTTGDILAFHVDSISGIARVTVSLVVSRNQ